MAEPQLRFAVLHHTGVAPEHFDLLLEMAPDRPLATWRCQSWPLPPSSIAVRQPDHRRVYLDYEGPVSGDRGEVRRVAGGRCNLACAEERRFAAEIELAGSWVSLELRNRDAGNWEITVRPREF